MKAAVLAIAFCGAMAPVFVAASEPQPGASEAAATLGAAPVASPAATSAARAPVALPAEFARILRDYEKAWMAGDVAALAALFADDGYALPNGQPPAAGAVAIRAAYQRNAGSPLGLRALHYVQSGDMAYIIGGYGAGAGKPDFGKFVLVLRRAGDGSWRIAADMDNTNATPRRNVPPGG